MGRETKSAMMESTFHQIMAGRTNEQQTFMQSEAHQQRRDEADLPLLKVIYAHAALLEQRRTEDECRLRDEQATLRRQTKARKRVTKQRHAERAALFKHRCHERAAVIKQRRDKRDASIKQRHDERAKATTEAMQ